MKTENDSNMQQYLCKHLRREIPAEKRPGRRWPQPHSNPRNGRSGQLKHMREPPPLQS